MELSNPLLNSHPNQLQSIQYRADPMQLVEIVEQVLETGVLPVATERQIHKLLKQQNLNPTEQALVEKLIDGLMSGVIKAIN